MRIPNPVKFFSIAVGLYQGLIIAHEFVHMAIYKYAGIPAKLEIGLLWGQVVPAYVPTDPILKANLVIAHSIYEALLPIEFLLILIVAILFYNLMEANDPDE